MIAVGVRPVPGHNSPTIRVRSSRLPAQAPPQGQHMTVLKEALVPDIGDFTGIPVIEILVAVGDSVGKDQSLVTLESDKATMEVPAPFAGTIRELKVKLGDNVSEGSVVAMIEPADATASTPAPVAAAPAAAPASAPAVAPIAAAAPAAPAPASSSAPIGAGLPPVRFDASAVLPDKVPYASPAVRLFARELGVDLARVTGSARGGRISKEDVQQFVKAALQGGGTSVGGASAPPGGGLNLLPWPKIDFSKFGEIETRELSRIKKISGANLAEF